MSCLRTRVEFSNSIALNPPGSNALPSNPGGVTVSNSIALTPPGSNAPAGRVGALDLQDPALVRLEAQSVSHLS